MSGKKKWNVYARVVTSIFVGEVEAVTREEALRWGENNAEEPTVCAHCSRECFGNDFCIDEIDVEEVQP